MTWVTEEIKAILKTHGAHYFASKGEDREATVTLIVTDTNIDGLPDGLETKVKVWYNNSSSLFREESGLTEVHTKMKIKRWDAKMVAREMYEDRYEEIKSEQKECQDTSTSRNHGELKEEEKCKLACGNADKEVAAFVRKMQEVYGVRMLCLSSYTDPEGKAQTSVHETTTISPKFSSDRSDSAPASPSSNLAPSSRPLDPVMADPTAATGTAEERMTRIEATLDHLMAFLDTSPPQRVPSPAPSPAAPAPDPGSGIFANIVPGAKSVLRPNPRFVFV
ncbi:hypothetical protein C8R46DRAFT_1214065 [Mycena filopes]|nr:hypothetical protein C8R46DRAFT_1214065 [Mycena filopes]